MERTDGMEKEDRMEVDDGNVHAGQESTAGAAELVDLTDVNNDILPAHALAALAAAGHVVDLTGDEDEANSVFWVRGREECGVCWERFEVPARSPVKHVCGHVICWLCSVNLLKSNSVCGFCGREL
jgi:hypothetical protein